MKHMNHWLNRYRLVYGHQSRSGYQTSGIRIYKFLNIFWIHIQTMQNEFLQTKSLSFVLLNEMNNTGTRNGIMFDFYGATDNIH